MRGCVCVSVCVRVRVRVCVCVSNPIIYPGGVAWCTGRRVNKKHYTIIHYIVFCVGGSKGTTIL